MKTRTSVQIWHLMIDLASTEDRILSLHFRELKEIYPFINSFEDELGSIIIAKVWIPKTMVEKYLDNSKEMLNHV